MAGFDYSRSNHRWQHVRERALRRDGYRCREARRYGRSVEAQVVHHVWPAEDYPEYAYCLWNLISLSAAAHDRMHERTTRRLTDLGEAWRARIPPPPGNEKWGACSWAGKSAHTRRKNSPEKNPGRVRRSKKTIDRAKGARDADAKRGQECGHAPRRRLWA